MVQTDPHVVRREVRLGLVLYGGISLAVYENGVAQELHRAFRGDGIYGLIRELIDSDIIVDVISGASAGGMNGVMLAYALANQCEFAPSAQLWRDQAGIEQLLHAEKGEAAKSVLNSDYYQQQLENCFRNTLKPDPSAPALEELDLFVTGTDAQGAVSTLYDEAGHPIDIKSHRALFRLKYRRSRESNDLKPEHAKDLATLCQLTSCFPVAFKPVQIANAKSELVRWGKLRVPDTQDGIAFLDGGILNNKPFTSTIEAIRSRTARGDVERFLIYVEPDPENFPTDGEGNVPPPSVFSAATKSLLSIPRYQSIAADLEAVQAHNERAEKLMQIASAIRRTENRLASSGTREVWTSTEGESPYKAARLIQLRDAAVEALLDDDFGRRYFSSEDERRSARILVESFNEWEGEGGETLKRYDVFFRKRRADYLTQVLMRGQKDGTTREPRTWNLVNHFFKLYEMVEFALTRSLNTDWHYNWRSLSKKYRTLDAQLIGDRRAILARIAAESWGEAKAVLETLLSRQVAVPSDDSMARSVFFRDLQNPSTPSGNANILDKVDVAFYQALGELDDAELIREFDAFFETDRQLFPLQVGSGFESTLPIRVVRFSPQDAKRGRSKGEVSKKVRGLALGAFGGFLKKSWRANDIRVGRLDAACSLIECLVTKERLAAVGKKGLANARVYCGENGPGRKYSQLLDSIATYVDREGHATDPEWSNLVTRLVETYHEEIHNEEIDFVSRAAEREDREYARVVGDKVMPAEKLPGRLLADVGLRAAGRLKQSLVASESTDQARKSVEKNAIYWLTFNVAYRAYAGWHFVSGWFRSYGKR